MWMWMHPTDEKPHMLMPLLGTLFSPLDIFAVHVMHTINELNVLTASVNHFQIDSGLWTTRVAEIGSIGGYCAASTPMAQLHNRFRSIRCQTSWKLIHDWIRKPFQNIISLQNSISLSLPSEIGGRRMCALQICLCIALAIKFEIIRMKWLNFHLVHPIRTRWRSTFFVVMAVSFIGFGAVAIETTNCKLHFVIFFSLGKCWTEFFVSIPALEFDASSFSVHFIIVVIVSKYLLHRFVHITATCGAANRNKGDQMVIVVSFSFSPTHRFTSPQ